jgi:Uma2 family endonuclease
MAVAEPTTRRWRRDEYYRMAEAGLFDGQRVELIDGEILVLPPMKNAHAVGIGLVQAALQAAFGPGYWVRLQGPLSLTPTSEPEPDVAVVPGGPRDFTDHPSTALLVVEVSDTSLSYDRGRKASLYASAGIADYWVLNLTDRQLEVFRRPQSDTAQPFAFRYADAAVLPDTAAVTPLAAAQASVRVADLLP